MERSGDLSLFYPPDDDDYDRVSVVITTATEHDSPKDFSDEKSEFDIKGSGGELGSELGSEEIAGIMEHGGETSLISSTIAADVASPPYEPRRPRIDDPDVPYGSWSDDSHLRVGSFSPDFPVTRIQAERNFRNAADKLDEVVRGTKLGSGDYFLSPGELSDVAIYTHANTINAGMEVFLKEKVVSEATGSKISKFIDKWFQATFIIVKSTSIPTPYLSVVNGFMCLIEISYRVTRVSKVVDETVEILYGAIALVQFDAVDPSGLIENEKVDSFLCSILNLFTAVTICLAECIAAVVTQIRNALVVAIKDNAGIKEAVRNVHLALEMHNRSVTTLSALLSRDAAMKKQKEIMLGWLLFGRPWEEKHRTCLNRRVAGIGDWVFGTDVLKAWLEDRSRILLCYGPGTALSNELLTVTQSGCNIIDYLARTLKAPEQCVVYFYLDQNELNQNAEFVVRSLLKQLAFQLSGRTELPPEPVKSAYDRFSLQGNNIYPNIRDFSEIFIACAKLCRTPVYVLLDGYDKYEYKNQLTSTLIRFIESGFVKVYITTRTQLREIQWPLQPTHLKIETPDIEVDRFIRANIESKNYHPDLEEKIVKAVTQNAKGMMLTAHYQLLYLLQFGNPRKLEAAVENLPVHSETAFPQGETVYAYNFYRTAINKMVTDKEVDDQPLRVVSWVFHAARPLNIEELVEAVAVDKGRKELLEKYKAVPKNIIKCGEPLVDYDKSTRVVKFTHDTVREFLEQHCKAELLPPQELAKTCLAYLGLDEFNQPCPDEKALEIRLARFRFTEYACEYWGYHARGAATHEAEIEEILFRTLDTANKLQSLAQINRYYADVGRFETPQQTTLLHILALNGLSTFCKRLLDKKLQDGGRIHELIDARDDRGWSALHFAAWNGHVSVLELLTDERYWAAQIGDITSTPGILYSKFLLSPLTQRIPSLLGAGDVQGFTPLHFAAGNGHLSAVQFIRDKANLEAKNYRGETPLHLAAQMGHLDILKVLIGHHANVFAKDALQLSAIHWATRKGHKDLVEYLINQDPRILTEPGGYGQTALHEAAAIGNIELVQLLIQTNADLKSKTQKDMAKTTNPDLLTMITFDDETALHAAVGQGHLAVAKYLVDNKIDVDQKDRRGQTAEDLANNIGRSDIAKFLHRITIDEYPAMNPTRLEEMAQPGPIPATTTPTGQTVRVAVARPKRSGYRQPVFR